MKTVDPDGNVIEWVTDHEWILVDGSALMMSRPKDQDQDEPDPTRTQSRTLGWTGYSLTVKEFRGWLDQIPDQATLFLSIDFNKDEYGIKATWEIP